jgi:beta-phosphoglucomutase-like phosphatase (HAD superfamily)
MIICSGGRRETIELIMEKLRFFMELIFFSIEDYSNPKPAPDVYIKGINYLNLEIDEIAVFDDSFTGVESAMLAGIKNIYYLNTYEEEGMGKLNFKDKIKSYNDLDFEEFLIN